MEHVVLWRIAPDDGQAYPYRRRIEEGQGTQASGGYQDDVQGPPLGTPVGAPNGLVSLGMLDPIVHYPNLGLVRGGIKPLEVVGDGQGYVGRRHHFEVYQVAHGVDRPDSGR